MFDASLPMTATQQLLAYQTGRSLVQAGDEIAVPVSWWLASELALNGMLITHREVGEPRLARPDRFVLAVDHTVSSFGSHHPVAQGLVRLSDQFRDQQGLAHFYGANESILHTAPYEELFRPGDVIVGADSHSIFHGGLGAFSIGLGGADVMMSAVLGSLLFTVPEAIQIEIDGDMPTMWTGKDLILAILQRFRRNSIAFERTVEYTGSALKHLSASDRGTVCNMGAEFGAMTSFFPADQTTARFVANRKRWPEFSQGGLYFAADPEAPYVARDRIGLMPDLPPKIGKWPSPDNVFDVDHPEVAGHAIDIAFVGTCTTTPEEYVLAALTADAALKAGRPRVSAGDMARLLSPSSIGIFEMLQRYDLVRPLEELGFKVGRAGCSLCLAVDGFKAPAGTWVLGSHNRPFPNRTGQGSKSMVASAATVVASSVGMKVTDPRQLLPHFDRARYAAIRADLRGESLSIPEIRLTRPIPASTSSETAPANDVVVGPQDLSPPPSVIRTKVVLFGDNIDTDAIIAGRFCHLVTREDLGLHAFENDMGEGGFRRKVHDEGKGAIVAGMGWGSGSSREHAVLALQGAGVQIVLAQNIAFIHRLNLVTQAVPFRLIHPDEQEAFYEKIQEGMEIEADLEKNQLKILETGEIFRLMPLKPVEQAIQSLGGLAAAYKKFGDKTIEAVLALARQLEKTAAT